MQQSNPPQKNPSISFPEFRSESISHAPLSGPGISPFSASLGSLGNEEPSSPAPMPAPGPWLSSHDTDTHFATGLRYHLAETSNMPLRQLPRSPCTCVSLVISSAFISPTTICDLSLLVVFERLPAPLALCSRRANNVLSIPTVAGVTTEPDPSAELAEYNVLLYSAANSLWQGRCLSYELPWPHCASPVPCLMGRLAVPGKPGYTKPPGLCLDFRGPKCSRRRAWQADIWHSASCRG